jgi:hypothetical protein
VLGHDLGFGSFACPEHDKTILVLDYGLVDMPSRLEVGQQDGAQLRCSKLLLPRVVGRYLREKKPMG